GRKSIDKRRLKKADPGLQDDFFDSCQSLLDEIALLQQEVGIACLRESTAFARRHIENVKQTGQLLTFSDQLTRLLEALRAEHGSTLAAALRKAMPVAMIDEFLDTDAVQYAIFRHIYFQPSESADADPLVAEQML